MIFSLKCVLLVGVLFAGMVSVSCCCSFAFLVSFELPGMVSHL